MEKLLHSALAYFAIRLVQIQSVSNFLNVKRLKQTEHGASAFSTCTLRHLRSRLASLDKRQVTNTTACYVAAYNVLTSASLAGHLGLRLCIFTLGWLVNRACSASSTCVDATVQYLGSVVTMPEQPSSGKFIKNMVHLLQAVVADRLEASFYRGHLCEQQLESKAVSLSGKQVCDY